MKERKDNPEKAEVSKVFSGYFGHHGQWVLCLAGKLGFPKNFVFRVNESSLAAGPGFEPR